MGPDAYRIFEAPQHLQRYVRRFMVADLEKSVDTSITPAPTGYNYFGWVFAGECSVLVDGVYTPTINDAIHVAGQIQHQDISVSYKGKVGHILAECTAAGFYELTHVPGENFNGYAGPFPDHAPSIYAQFNALRQDNTFPDDGDRVGPRLEFFIEFLTYLSQYSAETPDYVKEAIEQIESRHGSVKIADIIPTLGVSQRQLDRSFKKIVGVRPKYFASVLQLNKALEAMFANDEQYLTTLAQQAGYYDQAHFIKVMQKFFGQGPQAFLQSDDDLLSTFLGKSRAV